MGGVLYMTRTLASTGFREDAVDNKINTSFDIKTILTGWLLQNHVIEEVIK